MDAMEMDFSWDAECLKGRLQSSGSLICALSLTFNLTNLKSRGYLDEELGRRRVVAAGDGGGRWLAVGVRRWWQVAGGGGGDSGSGQRWRLARYEHVA
ncbi:unnamed protein product [Prunus armeniaca]